MTFRNLSVVSGTLISLLMFSGIAHAQTVLPISITFASDILTTTAGSTITFAGSFTNISTGSVTITSDGTSEVSSVLTTDDTPFFTNVPANLVLAAGASFPFSGSFTDLLDVTVSSSATVGTYKGNFQLIGNPNGTTVVGSKPFTVNVVAAVVPESSTLLYGAMGAVALIGVRSVARRKIGLRHNDG